MGSSSILVVKKVACLWLKYLTISTLISIIKVIRELQVMLDKDLATLYGVETRTLNQAVKRNIQRFPSDFRVQLTMEECSKSQIEEYHSFREI